MELIKRTSLSYQEGKSDKVYEVDLCQVGDDRYVVNFRYGRRGTNLKEGTKTDHAVSLAEAQKVFDKLITKQVTKGYQEVTAPTDGPAPQPIPKVVVPANGDARQQAILNRLANPRSPQDKPWPLERVIWRAGELKIQAAVPLLISLLGRGGRLQDYCIAWALGWCADESALPVLDRLYQDNQQPDFVRRIAWEAMLKLSDEPRQLELRMAAIAQLPPDLQEVVSSGSAEAIAQTLTHDLQSQANQRFAVLDTLYQINTPAVRSVVLKLLRTAPLRPNSFKSLRHIFKRAEYRCDGEVLGLLAYRLEKEQAMYHSNPYYIRLPDGGYLSRHEYKYDPQTQQYSRIELNQLAQEMQRPDARIAYSDKTRDYLRRRVWRTLKHLGQFSDLDYLQMAVGVLLPFTDADAQPIKQSIFYAWDRSTWNRYQQDVVDWDIFAGYLTFNHILYENSPRYEIRPGAQAWRCKPEYKPGDPEPRVREEAFPDLWEQQPAHLLRLLLASQCQPVHQFAVKALRTCERFCAQLETPSIIQLLGSVYEVTAQLGLDLAIARYNTHADPDLVLAAANSALSAARTIAYQWIEQDRSAFLADAQLIASLITSSYTDTRQFARRLLSSPIVNSSTATAIIGRVIARLITLEPTQAEIIQDAGEILILSFMLQLRSLGLGIVLDLLNHPVLEVQELGARILLNHETPVTQLPPGLVDSLINSSHESIRRIGVQLLGQLPDENLLGSDRLLLTMLLHELADIRETIRPVIQRLGSRYAVFSQRFVVLLIEILLQPETHEGIHRHLREVLQVDLTDWIAEATQELALRLLHSPFAAAQELAGVLLGAHKEAWAADFETFDLVQLANHEILTIRTAARDMLLNELPRLRSHPEELSAAVKLLESNWEDSREFGFRLFSTFFQPADFTPGILISLCDSNRAEVRKFGRDLVSRCFQATEGQEYLLKFSEHPAADMQLFATNYLEGYAVDDCDRLQELTPYFIRALSQVNKGRVAKQRIFAFLDREAQKSEAAARIVAEILTRQSATVAIADKATTIQMMLKIHRTYPHIPLPIQVKPTPAR